MLSLLTRPSLLPRLVLVVVVVPLVVMLVVVLQLQLCVRLQELCHKACCCHMAVRPVPHNQPRTNLHPLRPVSKAQANGHNTASVRVGAAPDSDTAGSS